MKSRGERLSRLSKCWTRFPQVVTNIMVREKLPFEEMDAVPKLILEAETELTSQGGRVLLRYSGTEPKARLLVEGRETGVVERWSLKISDAIRRQVGA